MKWIGIFMGVIFAINVQAQKDSVYQDDARYIMLSEIVVNRQLDVPAFINRIKNDTTFYKAFRNLRIVNYTALNDIRMMDKNGKTIATLKSETQQIRENNCRRMNVLKEETSGDFYLSNRAYNYYTAQMYASLFFTKGIVCGENNIVGNRQFSTAGLSGLEKRKEQLRMLFFNPGERINGLPFISNKTAIFGDDMANKYDMKIDYKDYMGEPCYVFTMVAKKDKLNQVVINEMTTYFSEKKYEVLARNYSLSYRAGVYDFNIDMDVQMTHVGELLVPAVIRYNGDWKVLFKKREHGIFTATLFNFKK